MTRRDYKLFFSIVLWSVLPFVYYLIRMNVVSVSGVDINILGQMEWFDLMDEVIVTTFTVPLYYLLKPDKSCKARNGFAFALSFGVYFVFTVFMVFHIFAVAEYMQAEHAARYLMLQSVSLLESFISTFMFLLFTLNDDYKTVCFLTGFKVVASILLDLFFISRFLEEGASYSEIAVNVILAAAAFGLAFRRNYIGVGRIGFGWIREWFSIGACCGIQIFLDNFIYAVMVCKMVNEVSEAGNYWIANNFIRGFLLVPVICLVEIIKKNRLFRLELKNTWVYCIGIIIGWVVSMPFWRWFISVPMASKADEILNIVYPLIPYYAAYMVSACIDGWFISKGKTVYNMINSCIVNVLYYGFVYFLFKKGCFSMDMAFIVKMFGTGMIVHLIFSVIFYMLEQKYILKRVSRTLSDFKPT